MATIYTHINKNKRDTFLIMFVFIAVVSFIGWFVGEYYVEGGGVFFVGLALVFSGVSGFLSYFYSDKIVLAVSGAKKVSEFDNSYVHNLVGNLCIGAGLPKPKIYMIKDTSMNAFATGRDPEHAVICFTSGIIERLEKRELEGVIAHELSHIGNYDIRLMSIVSVLVGMVTLLSDWFTRGMFYGRSRRRSRDSSIGGLVVLLGVVLVVLSPIIATLIKLAIGRRREYLADSSAALLTRYPQSLANALRKLARDTEILEAANGATAHLYVVSPLMVGGKRGFMGKLFATHPPVEERIRRLESM